MNIPPPPTAIAAMKELGYDLAAHASKSLDEVKEQAPFDAVVTMGKLICYMVHGATCVYMG